MQSGECRWPLHCRLPKVARAAMAKSSLLDRRDGELKGVGRAGGVSREREETKEHGLGGAI